MGVTAMIVQVEGSEIRLSICQTRRILKGTVYCGEETYELNGKERTYKSYRPLGKHVPTLKSSKAPTNYFTPNILRKSWSRLVVSVVHLDALAFPVAAM